jgi:hypothetical protein
MIVGDILLILEGILIAFLVNPYSIIVSSENIFFKFTYFLCFIFGIIMLIVGIRELKKDIHNYILEKKKFVRK